MPQAATMTTTKPESRRLAFIDLLRGVAILTVVVHHLPEQFGDVFGRLQAFGGRGVDLFFVLSGFLIGSTCLERAEKPVGALKQAKAYWLLRTLRIWPLYFSLLLLFFLQLPPLHAEPGTVLRQVPWHYVFFFSNDVGQPSLELGVLWSLAIEEQYYLVIGLIVMLASRKRETLEAAFIAVGLTAVVVALRYRTDLIHLREGTLPAADFTFRLYFSTLSRIDQLGLGLIASVAAPRFNRLGLAATPRGARLTTWAAVVMVLGVILYMPQRPRWEFTLVGVLLAGSVLWLQRPAVRTSLRLLAIERVTVAVIGNVGRLSFGFYLLHPVTRRWVLSWFEHQGWALETSRAPFFLASWVAISWALSALIYRLVEEPLLDWARRTSQRWVSATSLSAPTLASKQERA